MHLEKSILQKNIINLSPTHRGVPGISVVPLKGQLEPLAVLIDCPDSHAAVGAGTDEPVSIRAKRSGAHGIGVPGDGPDRRRVLPVPNTHELVRARHNNVGTVRGKRDAVHERFGWLCRG